MCIHTNAPKYVKTRKFIQHGIGVGKDATLHIIRQGVHVVGTDAWSWDAPFSITAKRWKEGVKANNPDPSIIWEGHYAGPKTAYPQ